MAKEFYTHSADETIAVGKKIGSMLSGGDIVAYKGGLGAGKTTITRGIVMGLGLKDDVSSPTFTLVNEYRGSNLTVYHFDMYRITSDELEAIGFYDYLSEDSVILIEWSENIADQLPDSAVIVDIERLGEDERKITVSGGDRLDSIGN